MAFLVTDTAGVQDIATTSTTLNHPLGMTVKAIDSTLGPGEFVYAKGVASTVVGDACVLYADGTTARAASNGANSGRIGIAMSANVANQYGWYQVYGAATVVQSAGAIGTANSACYMTTTAGQMDDTVVVGGQVIGANWSAQVRTTVLLSYPYAGTADAQS